MGIRLVSGLRLSVSDTGNNMISGVPVLYDKLQSRVAHFL